MKGVHHLTVAIAIFKLIHCKLALHSLPTLAASHLYCKTQENLRVGCSPCFQQQRQSNRAMSQGVGNSLTQSTDKLTASLIQSESLTAMIFMLHF